VLNAISNAFRIPELRKKILFTLAMIALYRLGAYIPVPGVDVTAVQALVKSNAALGLLGLFSGGALEKFAVFSLGIMPYITSSIIMQLLQGVIPRLEQWQKEGETGQRKIIQWTRYMTLGLGFVESIGLVYLFQSPVASGGIGIQFDFVTKILIVMSLLAGTALIMWLSELITQRGVGNGMSLLIFASIVARFPEATVQSLRLGNPFMFMLIILVLLVTVAAIVTMERGQRRIPVQYARRVVGRKVYGGMGTYIPLKINGANVIPIIFASSVLYFPTVIAKFSSVPWLTKAADAFARGGLLYLVFFAGLIIFFTYFYTALIFNPIDLADNLRKQGGFVPGVRPGKATVTYIENVLNRLTLPGAVFLAIIAILPTVLFQATNVVFLRSFGGTSILIMVGVSLETMRQLESQLKMRHYDGFFK
jgi:preprotein translocase subunit SecY